MVAVVEVVVLPLPLLPLLLLLRVGGTNLEVERARIRRSIQARGEPQYVPGINSPRTAFRDPKFSTEALAEYEKGTEEIGPYEQTRSP